MRWALFSQANAFQAYKISFLQRIENQTLMDVTRKCLPIRVYHKRFFVSTVSVFYTYKKYAPLVFLQATKRTYFKTYFNQILKMKDSVLYLLRASLIPVLSTDISAGSARYVHLGPVAVLAVRALPKSCFRFLLIRVPSPDNVYTANEPFAIKSA